MDIFITAEIGINHNGDLNICKKLIDVAVDSGCDAVKFQKRSIDKVYTKEFLKEKRGSPWGTTQRDQKEGLEFGLSEYKEIDNYCKNKQIVWFSNSTFYMEKHIFKNRCTFHPTPQCSVMRTFF